MAARSIRRWLARAPPPRLQPRTPEQPRSFLREIQRASSGSTPARNFASHSPRECIGGITRRAKEGRSARSGPRFYAAERRTISPDVGHALLGFRLGCGYRLRRQLQHGCLLTLDEFGQQYGLPIRKLECVVMHPRLVLVDLAKDRRLVGHPARAPPEESGRDPCNVLGKRKFRPRKHAYCRGGIFLGGKAARAGTKVACRELVADSCS